MFNYDTFLVTYDPNTGSYTLTDIAYEITLGQVTLESGPGWILNLALGLTFLDASQAMCLANFLNDLNGVLSNA